MVAAAGLYGPEVVLNGNLITPVVLALTSVTVKNTDNSAATLYTSATGATTTSNVITTDAAGRLSFYAVPGFYKLVYTDTVGAQSLTVEVPMDAGTADATYVASVVLSGTGIDPTGVADSTTAIQAKLDSLPAAGGSVFVPRGKYLISALTISKPTRLFGVGSGDQYGGVGYVSAAAGGYVKSAAPCAFLCSSATAVAITVTAAGFTMADLAVLNTAGSVPTAGAALRITAGDGARIDRCRFVGFYDNVSFEQSEYAVISGCWFGDSVRYGLYTRNLLNADQGDMLVVGCGFSHTGSHSRVQGSAIRWESGGGLKVLGCKINSRVGQYNYGIDLACTTGVVTSVMLFNNNSIENTAQIGIRVAHQAAAAGVTLNLITIKDNEIAYSAGSAIDIRGSSGGFVTDVNIGGNVFRGNGLYSIVLDWTDRVSIEHNRHWQQTSALIVVGGSVNSIPRIATQAVGQGSIIHISSSRVQGAVASEAAPYQMSITPPTLNAVTYTSIASVLMSANDACVLRVHVTGIIQTVGGIAVVNERLVTRNAAGTACVLTTVGTDVQAGSTLLLQYLTDTAGLVTLQAKLNVGTQFNGTVNVMVTGFPEQVSQLA